MSESSVLSRRSLVAGLSALAWTPAVVHARPKGIKGRLDEVKQSLAPGFTAGSQVHAYQSYAFVYNFANANVVTHQRAVGAIQKTGLPMMQALIAAGASPRLDVHTDPHDDGRQWYGLDLVVQTKAGTVRIPGGNPTDPAAWTAATNKVSKATGLPLEQVQHGHAAWFDLVRVLNGLDTEATTLIGHAFALEVLREQTRAGQQADWFGPRPPEETLSDTAAAQALIADDVDRVRGAQAAVLATIALANHCEKPGAIEALEEELAATAADLTAWKASHRQPTPADFGVVYSMPNPETVKATLDEQLGVIGAAAKVVRGAATGDLPRTLDGLAGLAPKDTKIKAVAEGLAAASKGDIQGTLGAIADLGGPDTAVGRVAGRLEKVAGVLELVPG